MQAVPSAYLQVFCGHQLLPQRHGTELGVPALCSHSTLLPMSGLALTTLLQKPLVSPVPLQATQASRAAPALPMRALDGTHGTDSTHPSCVGAASRMSYSQ